MKNYPALTPQVTRDEAIQLSKRYDTPADERALAAGSSIRDGYYAVSHFKTIFQWKTNNRGKSRLLRNSDAEIQDALSLAVHAKEPRSAMAVLVGLHGVDIPVASAIMTCIDPTNYTVIDYRALEALGTDTLDRSLPFYLVYLRFSRNLAQEWEMSLRQLDRALWQWSKERTPMPK